MLRIVSTENGKIRGTAAADPRITVFRGIPFAAPPVGKNRWRAPQPCENWEGVRDCLEFAPISVQNPPGVGAENIYTREWNMIPDIPMSEDCLYLNVWTPAKSPEEKLPVMFWIFGEMCIRDSLYPVCKRRKKRNFWLLCTKQALF